MILAGTGGNDPELAGSGSEHPGQRADMLHSSNRSGLSQSLGPKAPEAQGDGPLLFSHVGPILRRALSKKQARKEVGRSEEKTRPMGRCQGQHFLVGNPATWTPKPEAELGSQWL